MAVVCIGLYTERGGSSRGVALAAMLELSGLSEVLKSNPGLSAGSSCTLPPDYTIPSQLLASLLHPSQLFEAGLTL